MIPAAAAAALRDPQTSHADRITALAVLEKSKAPTAWRDVAAAFPFANEALYPALVKALRRLGAADAAACVLSGVASEDDAVAALVVFRLLRPRGAVLDATLAHPSVRVRREAALAASAVPMHDALARALCLALNDGDRLVRDYVVAALRSVPSARDALSARLAIETDDLVLDDLQRALAR